MNLTLPPLPLVDDDLSQHTDDLPQVLPRFFIPRLQEKPQDPIMDTLRIELESGVSQPGPPLGLMNMVEVNVQECSHGFPEEEDILFWERAVKWEVRVQVSELYPLATSQLTQAMRSESNPVMGFITTDILSNRFPWSLFIRTVR